MFLIEVKTQCFSLNLKLIKVFVKHKILSAETILSTYIHTHAGTREHSDYTQFNLHSLKLAANSDLRWMKTTAWNQNHGRSTVLGK